MNLIVSGRDNPWEGLTWEREMPVKLENVQITSYQLGVLDNNASTADVDSFVFKPQTSGEPSAPAVSELVVTKVVDCTSPGFHHADGFVGGVFVAAGDVDGTDGAAMGDGSVRFLGSDITMDLV